MRGMLQDGTKPETYPSSGTNHPIGAIELGAIDLLHLVVGVDFLIACFGPVGILEIALSVVVQPIFLNLQLLGTNLVRNSIQALLDFKRLRRKTIVVLERTRILILLKCFLMKNV